jgi:hypothetical protein
MKPITAVTLRMANTNSASPYPFTPNRLMTTIMMRNKVTNIAWFKSGFQYPMVYAPAMISRGRTTIHCRA